MKKLSRNFRKTTYNSRKPSEKDVNDLIIRFILNAPIESLEKKKEKSDSDSDSEFEFEENSTAIPDKDISRLFFQLEKAHWYYCDVAQSNFRRQISFQMFVDCISNQLMELGGDFISYGKILPTRIKTFNLYKNHVPVCGCIMLSSDMERILLVQGCYGTTWGFPRGKINEKESEQDCAIRETKEETSFDVSKYITDETMTWNDRGKKMVMFYCLNVPEDYLYKPLAKNEISQIGWHNLDLVLSRKNREVLKSYHRIMPRLKKVKQMILKKRKEMKVQNPNFKSNGRKNGRGTRGRNNGGRIRYRGRGRQYGHLYQQNFF